MCSSFLRGPNRRGGQGKQAGRGGVLWVDGTQHSAGASTCARKHMCTACLPQKLAGAPLGNLGGLLPGVVLDLAMRI